jgi:hypothetical protein
MKAIYVSKEKALKLINNGYRLTSVQENTRTRHYLINDGDQFRIHHRTIEWLIKQN